MFFTICNFGTPNFCPNSPCKNLWFIDEVDHPKDRLGRYLCQDGQVRSAALEKSYQTKEEILADKTTGYFDSYESAKVVLDDFVAKGRESHEN